MSQSSSISQSHHEDHRQTMSAEVLMIGRPTHLTVHNIPCRTNYDTFTFIYLLTTFIKRIIHNLMCSEALNILLI